MSAERLSHQCSEKVYKFKDRNLAPIWIGTMIGLFTFLGFMISRDGLLGGAIFLLCTISLFGVGGFFMLASKSDIVLSDRGISRSYFGATWQTMEWDNVRLIRAFPVYVPYERGARRGFNIYPRDRNGLSPMPAGKMIFGDKAENMSDLIETINHYIDKHKIYVEIEINGVRTRATRI